MLQLKSKSHANALDISEAMLAYAAKLAADMGAVVHFQHSNMQTFTLQVCLLCTTSTAICPPLVPFSAGTMLLCIRGIAPQVYPDYLYATSGAALLISYTATYIYHQFVPDIMQKPVNMAFMILGTFAHLLESSAALQCLHSIHAALKPNGILVLELAHPTDAFNGSLFEPEDWDEGDEQQPDQGSAGEIAVQYGKPGDQFDPVEQVIELCIHLSTVPLPLCLIRMHRLLLLCHHCDDLQVLQRTVTILEGDKAGKLHQIVSEVFPQRIFTFQELSLLAMMSNFTIVNTYGDMSIDSPLASEDAVRMVAVLKRI